MRGDERVVEFLNDVLTAELTIINQYVLSAKMCENWGLHRLAKTFRDTAFDEMRDAETVIERILYLDGLPNVQRLGSVPVGETPVEQIRLALACETAAVERLNRGVDLCREVGDEGTREFVGRMIAEEEQHEDLFETMLDSIDLVGEENFLARQLHAE